MNANVLSVLSFVSSRYEKRSKLSSTSIIHWWILITENIVGRWRRPLWALDVFVPCVMGGTFKSNHRKSTNPNKNPAVTAPTAMKAFFILSLDTLSCTFFLL